MYRFGKHPPKIDYRTLRLSDYLMPTLPPPPPAYSALDSVYANLKVADPSVLFPMDFNDQYGDCVIEGTTVQSGQVSAGYRAPYSGPVVTIKTESGRILTVTPNHAVLTPRGFTLARLLNEGDYTISGSLPKGAPGIDPHFNQAPTSIEQEVAALKRVRLSSAKEVRRMPVASDFHGDGRFMHGHIDVVATDGFLRREDHAALSEPEAEDQISATREPEGALHRQGATFQARDTGGATALGFMGSFGQGASTDTIQMPPSERGSSSNAAERHAPFSQVALKDLAPDSELGAERVEMLASLVPLDQAGQFQISPAGLIAQRQSLSAGPNLFTSVNHPAEQRGPTDAHVAGNLLSRFPGAITADRIIEVRHHDWSGHVYDLTTEQGWYIAGGIITHNCTIAALAHAETIYRGLIGQKHMMPAASVKKLYFKLSGGVDSGLNELDVLNYWRRTRVSGDKIIAYAKVNPKHHTQVQQAINLFGGLYIGFQCQEDVIKDFDARKPWTPGKLTNDGHAVYVTSYDADGVTVLTWGNTQKGTWAWWDECVDEAYALLPPEAASAGFAPGFNEAQLLADLKAVAA